MIDVVPFTEDEDEWDLEVFSKPSEVQNDLYAGNEDDEDEGEDVQEGRKVTVGYFENQKLIHKQEAQKFIFKVYSFLF